MSWWRRDPTLAPVQRYAQRVLLSREAALRTRCFSRSPARSAKHEDDDDGKRPAGLSNLEWMQLQHYKRWRKTFRDDPYRALFGASNDMLSGKGLTNWEWVSKSFPSWMVGEIDGDAKKPVEEKNGLGKNAKHSDSTARPERRPLVRATNNESTQAETPYPKKVEIVDESDHRSIERDSFFPQPSFRSSRFGRDESGITSPSDLRRPREHGTAASHDPGSTLTKATGTQNTTTKSSPILSSYTPSTPEKTDIFDGPISGPLRPSTQTSSEQASGRESSFIEEFFSETAQGRSMGTDTQKGKIPWAQTALQRRLSAKLAPKTEQKTSVSVKPSHDLLAILSSAVKEASEDQGAKSSLEKISTERNQQRLLDERAQMIHEEVKTDVAMNTDEITEHKDWPSERQPAREDSKNSGKPESDVARSTSEILQQLPKDDIDLLTAADIRASMAGKCASVDGRLEKDRKERRLGMTEGQYRHYLDTKFDEGRRKELGEEIVESRIINKHRRRRRDRELQDQEVPEISTTSTMEWLKQWLEKSGNVFASHFWQDPTEEPDAQKTKLYFDKVVTRVRKGRLAMAEVVEDLRSCIPASKPLLKRLKEDEELLDSAIQALRLRSPSRDWQGLTPKKVRTIQVLRMKFRDTDRELEEAYESLRHEAEGNWIDRVPLAFKRQLSIASKITHQNAHLTRYLVWSLQARLEDRDIDPKLLANYTAVANSLLTLRDTQMALARLVDRAMLTYKVVPTTLEDVKIADQTYNIAVPTGSRDSSREQSSSTSSSVNKAGIRANVAAEERLASEVEAQKLAMQGLSDDGYAHASKSLSKKSFDEQSPLAHSLFRPFGPVLASLGKDSVEEIAVKTTQKEPINETEEAKMPEGKDIEKVESWTSPTKKLSTQSPGTDAELNPDSVESPATVAPYVPLLGNETTQVTTEATEDSTSAEQASPTALESPATVAAPNSSTQVAPQAQPTLETSSDTSTSPSLTSHLPTHYTILIHDSETDKLSVTTSTTASPRDTTPPMPLHQALSTLNAPAKFIPFITEGLEVVSATKDMLVLRDALDEESSTRGFETVRAASTSDALEDSETERRQVNPIDGTARLSPTGYVGPEESPEQLEREFEERRQAASRFRVAEKLAKAQRELDEQLGKKAKGKGGAGRVVRTVIWAGVVCYVAGVVGEICTV